MSVVLTLSFGAIKSLFSLQFDICCKHLYVDGHTGTYLANIWNERTEIQIQMKGDTSVFGYFISYLGTVKMVLGCCSLKDLL